MTYLDLYESADLLIAQLDAAHLNAQRVSAETIAMLKEMDGQSLVRQERMTQAYREVSRELDRVAEVAREQGGLE